MHALAFAAVEPHPRVLIVRFAEPHRVVSWAIVGGGARVAPSVVWLEVSDRELRPPVDACDIARERLLEVGAPDAVALLTSRDVSTFVDLEERYGNLACRCVATVGLGNALRAGDPPGPSGRIGTINILCQLSVALTDEAMLEAMALAAEARTVAVREADVASRVSGAPASGTGTDCIVIAAPASASRHRYAGKHTGIGHLIGKTVHAAVHAGTQQWLRERQR
jgi:adenosylcobinamide amidohydrolase